MLQVTLYADPDISLYHCSYVLAGLFALAAQDRIALRCVEPEPNSWRRVSGSGVRVLFDVQKGPADDPISVCIDLLDKSNQFHLPLLGRGVLYFKRSYYLPDLLTTVPEAHRCLIRPFGLNFGCGNGAAWRAWLVPVTRTIARSLLSRRTHWARRTAREFLTLVRLPDVGQFQVAPEKPRESVVLFQTRLWADGEVVGQDSAEAVNTERIALVEALQGGLGTRFRGGVVPNAVGRRLRPDLLAPTRWDRRSYLGLQRSAGVAVYARGLHHSTAWKLGEYLAASAAIVSPPIRNALSAPLEDGVHLVSYDTPDGCVEACTRLLDDPARQAALRAEAARYYRVHVEPAAHMAAVLASVTGVESCESS